MAVANKRKTVIQGIEVEQVLLQGNWYTPVDGRVKIAQTADPATIRKLPGYHVVSVQIVPMGERYGYHCMVEYPVGSGIIMPGSDFIDMKDPSGLAKAETSAIGRALGLHGIASEEGIAPAEEMRRVVGQEHQQPIQQRQGGPQPIQTGQVARIKLLSADLHRKEPDFSKLDAAGAANLIRSLEADLAAKKPAEQEESAPAVDEPPANEQQVLSIRKLCAALGREEPAAGTLTFQGASTLIRQMSKEYNERRRAS